MTKAKLIAGFYRATSPGYWPRLTLYFFSWLAWRVFGLRLGGEQTLVFKPFRVVVEPGGLGGLVFLHEILARGIYDVPELERSRDLRTVFDAGANCGFFALKQSARNPDLNLYCFEPHPNTFERLKKNIAANQFTHVTPVHAAVGATSGTCQINVSPESSMAIVKSSSVQFLDAPKSVDVPLTSLDDFAAARNVWPDFMKIDVEGFEVEVLKGATRCLQHSRGVVLEYHSPELQRECDQLLKTAGFTTRVLKDGLISATKAA